MGSALSWFIVLSLLLSPGRLSDPVPGTRAAREAGCTRVASRDATARRPLPILGQVLLLALDTATPAVTVAVSESDDAGGLEVRAEATVRDPRRHGELLAPLVEQVLREAGAQRRELGSVVVGVGPGPFTGLRVGVVTARTLGTVLGIPVLGVCTQDALALAALRSGTGEGDRFLVATDARRREVHWAAYDGEARRLDGPHVSPPGDVPVDGAAVVGQGALLYPEALGAPPRGAPELPAASDLARWVAQGRPVLDPVPLYLRRPDAAEPGGRKRVLT